MLAPGYHEALFECREPARTLRPPVIAFERGRHKHIALVQVLGQPVPRGWRALLEGPPTQSDARRRRRRRTSRPVPAGLCPHYPLRFGVHLVNGALPKHACLAHGHAQDPLTLLQEGGGLVNPAIVLVREGGLEKGQSCQVPPPREARARTRARVRTRARAPPSRVLHHP